MSNGRTDIYCNIEKGTEYGTKQDLEKCLIRTINNYTYYFIDGEMVSGEDVEAWLEEKVWQQMIPSEEWGIVP